jgi:hypothetical protein
MMVYTQFRYWSIIEGRHVARLAVRNPQGDELFVIVPQDGSGAYNRSWRTKGLEALEGALSHEHPPGRVQVDEES